MSIASDKLVKECEEKMVKTIEAVKEKFTAIRAGRANVSMLDGVTVEAYGAPEVKFRATGYDISNLVYPIPSSEINAGFGVQQNTDWHKTLPVVR